MDIKYSDFMAKTAVARIDHVDKSQSVIVNQNINFTYFITHQFHSYIDECVFSSISHFNYDILSRSKLLRKKEIQKLPQH